MEKQKNYKLVRNVLVGIIFLNCVLAIVLIRKLYWTYPHPTKNASSRILYFLERQQYFEVFPKDSNSIIFLGNSLTQNFEVTELLRDINIKNRGIYGDYTMGVLNRIDPIIQTHPKKVFIEIGLNDLLHSIPRDTVLKNFQKIIDTLQAGNSHTKVYVQSLLPIAITGEAANLPHINEDIVFLNENLKQYALQHKATYVDLHSSFALNGTINPKYFISDGEHINGQGYLLWADLVKPYLRQ